MSIGVDGLGGGFQNDAVGSDEAMAMKTLFQGRPALWIVGIYTLFSVVWILASDQVVQSLAADPRQLTILQHYKGLAFVSCSAALLFVLIQKSSKALRQTSERLQSLSIRLIETQECERRHLARELHDEIGQTLTAAKITLQSAQSVSDAGSQVKRLNQVIALVDQLLHSVRTLSLNLRPPMLDDLGLATALRWLVDQQGRGTGLRMALDCPDFERRLEPAVETACFRVIQEALTNIARHAHATHAEIELRIGAGELTLCVRDNGIGFDVLQAHRRAAAGSSLGLLGMEERASLLGGRLEIQSAPGAGTEIRACFPVKTNS